MVINIDAARPNCALFVARPQLSAHCWSARQRRQAAVMALFLSGMINDEAHSKWSEQDSLLSDKAEPGRGLFLVRVEEVDYPASVF